jgi:hypothetical protein
MNKYLAWLPALIVLAAVVYKPVTEARKSAPESKDISLAIYKSSNYSSDIYDHTSAQVEITIEKVNSKGEHSVLWEKVLDAKSISYYPSFENALKQNITIHNLNGKKEYLVVNYTLTYNSKGSELRMHEGVIVKDKNSTQVDISI